MKTTEETLLVMASENATAAFLAGMAEQAGGFSGANEAAFSRMKSGTKLNHDAEFGMRNIIKRLEAFRDAAAPLPLRFSDAREVTRLLEEFEAGHLGIISFRPSDETEEVEAK